MVVFVIFLLFRGLVLRVSIRVTQIPEMGKQGLYERPLFAAVRDRGDYDAGGIHALCG